MADYPWPHIVGASRELLTLLRQSRGAVAPFVKNQSAADNLVISSIAGRVGNVGTLILHWFSINPHDDDSDVPIAHVTSHIWLQTQERPHTRIGAARVWRFYLSHVFPAFGLDQEVTEDADGAWTGPRLPDLASRPDMLSKLFTLSDEVLLEFEQAVELLDAATRPSTDSPSPASEPADSKADSMKKYPRSERVIGAIAAINSHRKKVARGRTRELPITAILFEYLEVPTDNREVKNLAR